MERQYTASKTRSQNRPGWSITFRHPLLKDGKGKPGRKMRRGLGTDLVAEADELVRQMNELLQTESWWTSAKRAEAEARFDRILVKAFYDDLQAGRPSPEGIREAAMPLPGASEGYPKVLFVGTTGSGKTSLLRQLIGSDPEEDRFPSTAPAKTTIADLEVVQAPGAFEAVVTFSSEFQIQAYVEECLLAASLQALDAASDAKVAEKFLNHSDQKFRLSYVLGAWPERTDDDGEEFSFEEKSATAKADTVINPKYAQVLQALVGRIIGMAKQAEKHLRSVLGPDYDEFRNNDKEAIESWFEEALYDASGECVDAFFGLVHDIMEEIGNRFNEIEAGALQKTHSDWPESWSVKTDDRAEFIRHVRWFSSNYWPEFGRLLTPIVQGIRVKGPLYPAFAAVEPRLVLIDGQGLGHTPDSASSVPMDITRRFSSVDVILLVDNAQQPMLAAPQSVLRAVAATGFHHKLAIAFTHFDLIKGDNLKSLDDKRAHVMGSVVQSIASLRDIIGAPVAKAVEASLLNRCIMLGGIDRRNDQLPAKPAVYMQQQLLQLIDLCNHAIKPVIAPEAAPIYDPTGLGFAVRDAVQQFIGPWSAKLGIGTYTGAHKEHFNRIKALNRRIAGEMGVEYDSLRPVADLVARLSESISLFLDKPIDWTRPPVDDAEAEASISQVRRNVAEHLHVVALTRLVDQHLSAWRHAFDFKGKGSASHRAQALKHIYDAAAPAPDTVMTQQAAQFVTEVRKLVVEAVRAAGGNVRLAEAA